MNLQEIRQKYPQYNDISDQQLADSYHQKYYSDIPKEDFYSRIGHKAQDKPQEKGLLRKLADYEQGLAVGLFQGGSNLGANIAQAPFDLYSYLSGNKGYKVPRPSFEEYIPASELGNIGSMIGEGIAPLGAPVVGAEYAAAKAASPLMKALAKIGVGAGIGAIESEDRMLGAGLGAAGALVSPAITAAKTGYNIASKPFKQLKEVSGYEKKLAEAMEKRNNYLSNYENTAANIGASVIPQKHVVDTKKALSEAFGKEKTKINNFFKESYGNYEHGEVGQRPVANPYKTGELDQALTGIAQIPKSTKSEAENISPKIKISEILDDEGKPFEIVMPSKNSKVQDYIRFMREARDASGLAYKKSKSQNATQSEKEKYLDIGRKLNRLSSDASKRAEATMTPKELEDFKNINSIYSSVGAPLKYNPTFARAHKGGNKLGKISGSFYNELLEPENEATRNYLTGSKNFKEALLGHVTEGKKNPFESSDFNKQVKNIESLLKDKILSGLLPKESKKQLQSIIDMSKHQKSIKGQMAKEQEKLSVQKQEIKEQADKIKNMGYGAVTALGLGSAGKYAVNKIFGHND